jgi:ribose transport system substrate-binding protein
MKRITAQILTAGALASSLALAGCGNDIPTAAGQNLAAAAQSADWNAGGKVQIPLPPKAEGKKIAFVGFGKDNAWSVWGFEALKAEAETLGAKATFVGPSTFDPQAQYQLVSDLAVAKQYDILVVVAQDGASLAPAVEKAAAAGIVVVPINMAVGPDPVSHKIQVAGIKTQVLEDLESNAQAMAEGVVDACEGQDPCKVDVLWGVRALAFDKVKPPFFQKVIAAHPNIHVVCESDAAYTQDLGRTQSADCLQAHPDLNVIAAQADESARGAESSLTAAGHTFGLGKDDVKIIGAYASHYGVQQVRAGKWLMTTYNRVASMGRAATRLGISVLHGDNVPSYVPMEDLDDAPLKLTKEVLEKRPDITGQWEG